MSKSETSTRNTQGSASPKNTETQHLSLYRKYRPHTFADVIGQDHVVDVLKESVKQGTIAHAYLFCGSRGTGKTSVARIFARALGTTQNDLYEIDAASNTSVDDIRELSEAVNTVPLESKYKVYILDEVHMLSKSAFNAFLKTLEEPPKHVIFILATTETEKLPETIVSRCEVYNFKKPTSEILKKVVLDVAKKEGATIDSPAAELIALLGDGSFRDTLGTLQKVLSFSNADATNISLKSVEDITGAPKASLVLDFVRGVLTKDAELSLTALRKASEENLSISLFSKLALMRLRYLLMKTISESEAKILAGDLSEADVTALSEIAKTVSGQQVAGTLRSLLEVSQSIGKTHIESLPLELMVAEVVGKTV